MAGNKSKDLIPGADISSQYIARRPRKALSYIFLLFPRQQAILGAKLNLVMPSCP
jgi:hypothetical protein